MTMRCFFALELPPLVQRNVSTAVAALKRQSGAAIRWVNPENLHLTLHFLGPAVPVERLKLLREPAQTIAEGLTSVELTTEHVGQLPPTGPARVIVVACDGPGMSRVMQLRARLGSMLHRHGFSIDPRPWRPHVTLGRVKGHLAQPLPAIACQPQRFRVSNFTLMQSVLTPVGPLHRPLETFRFGPP